MRYLIVIVMLTLVIAGTAAQAPALASAPQSQLPPCGQRPTYLSQPWIKLGLACLDEVINDPAAGELAFTALATAPDGTLYAARPMSGEVLAFSDDNGDGLPDTPHVIASGMTLPNGLDYHDGALYIAGGAHVYRLRDGGALETLVSDLPTGGGFWTGGIAVSDRIYVSTGAPCDFCAPDNPARGAVLSYALDGSDRQIVATGLRQPADLAFQGGDLYVVDSARSGLFDTPDLDELDRVVPGANFGFPYCVGLNNTPDMPGFDCATATAPIIALPTASNPIGITAYRGDAIPSLHGKLLIALRGSFNNLSLRGYWIAIADPATGEVDSLMPTRPQMIAANDYTLEQMNFLGSGFFPERPLDVAVNAQGWVYVSIGGGRIIALRP